jgi:hypothetical protein
MIRQMFDAVHAPRVKRKPMANTPGRQAAQAKYNSKPEQVKRREGRNKARAIMEKKGLVRKGDGQDVDHADHNTADESSTNLRVQSKSTNRSHNRRDSSGRLIRLGK